MLYLDRHTRCYLQHFVFFAFVQKPGEKAVLSQVLPTLANNAMLA